MKKILVIKHGALGDMIFAQGAFQAIRTHHPKDPITLLTTSPYVALAKAMGLFDTILVDDRPRPLSNPLSCIKLFLDLKKEQFTQVYDLQKSKRTRQYMALMKAFFKPRPQWCSKFPGADFAYTDPQQNTLHIYDRHANLLKTAGIERVPNPNISWMHEPIEALNLPPQFFLFVPGCSPTQPHKRWPAESYGAIGNFLLEKGITPVILGRDEEKEAAETIQRLCPGALSLLNKTTLFQVAELGRHAVGALGHDTGPMHIVAATHCPSLLLFSHSSIPEHYAPRGFKATVIQEETLANLSLERVKKTLHKTLKI